MFSDVARRIKKKNRLFFSKQSPCLEPLYELIKVSNRRAVVMRAFDCATFTLNEFESKYPQETRPRKCLEMSMAWAKGEIKMPTAKRFILECHAVRKDLDDLEFNLLAQAIAHAASTVHAKTHALGLAIYELTALILKNGKKDYETIIREKLQVYQDRLLYWQVNINIIDFPWAKFIRKDEVND